MARHQWEPTCDPPKGLTWPIRVGGPGAPTRAQARGADWIRTNQGHYVPAHTDLAPPEQRILNAVVPLPQQAAVSGWAACRWMGATFLDGLASGGETLLDVPLVVGTRGHLRPRPGVTVSREAPPSWETWECRGLRITRPERAVADAMHATGDLREAVVVLEMAYAAELTSPRRLRAFLAARRRSPRHSMLHRAADRASVFSRSPQEPRLRQLVEDDAGLPALLVNCPVHSLEGRLLGIADLLDPRSGLVIEYDGADHRSIKRHTADVGKDDRFASRGLEVTRVTGTDLHHPGRVVARVLRARERALFEPVEQRRWVPRPPVDDLDTRLDGREAFAIQQEWWDEQDAQWAG